MYCAGDANASTSILSLGRRMYNLLYMLNAILFFPRFPCFVAHKLGLSFVDFLIYLFTEASKWSN